MTRKDYVQVAKVLHNTLTHGGDEDTVMAIAFQLSTVFKMDNSRFNHDRFMVAVKEG